MAQTKKSSASPRRRGQLQLTFSTGALLVLCALLVVVFHCVGASVAAQDTSAGAVKVDVTSLVPEAANELVQAADAAPPVARAVGSAPDVDPFAYCYTDDGNGGTFFDTYKCIWCDLAQNDCEDPANKDRMNTHCVEILPSPDSGHTSFCICKPGYEFMNDSSLSCKDVTCPFIDNGGPVDIWGEARYGPCDYLANCAVSALGKAVCTCKPGWAGNGTLGGCTKIDYCKTNNGGCSPYATCKTLVDLFHDPTKPVCTCKAGYYGNGKTCTPKANVQMTVPARTVKRGLLVSLSATLVRSDNKKPIPWQPVRFYVGALKLPLTVKTNVNGMAVYSYRIPATTTAGRKVVTAQFLGTATINPKNGTAFLTVTL